MKKPRPIKAIGRKRRAAGWTLVTLGLLVAGVWVATGWCTPHFVVGEHRVALYRGVLYDLVLPTYSPPTAAMKSSLSKRQLVADQVQREKQQMVVGLWGRIAEGAGPEGWRWLDEEKIGLVANLAFIAPDSVRLAQPAWPFPLMLWTTGGLALWSGRRARRRALEGHCPTCGYNLAGLNADASCPECGRKAAATA